MLNTFLSVLAHTFKSWSAPNLVVLAPRTTPFFEHNSSNKTGIYHSDKRGGTPHLGLSVTGLLAWPLLKMRLVQRVTSVSARSAARWLRFSWYFRV